MLDEFFLFFRLLKGRKGALISLKTESKMYMTEIDLLNQLGILQFFLPDLQKQVISFLTYNMFVGLFISYL